MALRAFASATLLAAACTIPNPAWIADGGSSTPSDAGVTPAADFSSSPVADGSTVTDMSTDPVLDLLHPHSEPDLATQSCKEHKTESSCSVDLSCYWTGSKCKPLSDPLPNCSMFTSQNDCVVEDGCEWQQLGDIGSCFLAN